MYESLEKLSYTAPDEREKIYHSRSESEGCFPLHYSESGNPCFFFLAPDVYTLSLEILKTDREISLLTERIPEEKLNRYAQDLLVDEIVSSNRMEGVVTTHREIRDTLEGLDDVLRGNADHRFYGMVGKYRKILSEEEIPLRTCEDIRNVYDDLILPELKKDHPHSLPDGVLFRKERVGVYNGAMKLLHQGAYPESAIYDSLQSALEFLNDPEIPNLLRLCTFHYLLESIHPFYDGNGRLGRFLFSYGLSQELNPLTALNISATIDSMKRTYYKAFQVCESRRNLGDLTPFLLMMLSMILETEHTVCPELEELVSEDIRTKESPQKD